ncbi:MAG: hypothetical protein EVA65_15595 [Oceanococcus sp.]|nr:MAG: hypothetical protein EVA65_15595 [Oceanococcus sp.]
MNVAREAWSIIEADSRPVELATAGFIAIMGLSCFFGGWFGGWLPSLESYAGKEILVAGMCVFMGAYQIVAVIFDFKQLRWVCCMCASAALMTFALVTFSDYGFDAPGGPVGFFGALTQLWAGLAVASDMRRDT